MQRRTYPQRHRRPGDAARSGGGVLWLVPVALVVTWFVAAPAASATPLPPRVPLITYAPSGPLSSGQLIEVRLSPNNLFEPGTSLTIEECAAPGHQGDDRREQCDSRTRQQGHLVAGAKGTLDYPDYPVYALPDAFSLHESPNHRPVCDLTHACVLVIGLNSNDHDVDGDSDGDGDHDSDGSGESVSSLPFLVGPDPPPSTPEVPPTP